MATQFSAVTGKKKRSPILDIIRAQAPLVTQDKVLGQQLGVQQEQQELEQERFDLEKVQQAEDIAANKRFEDIQRMQGEEVQRQGEEARKQGRIATGIEAVGTGLDVARTVQQLGGVSKIASNVGSAVKSIGSFFSKFF